MLGGSPSLVDSPDVRVEYEYRKKSRCSWNSLILYLQTQATPPRKHCRPDSFLRCSRDLVSVSLPLQPGHQGSAGGGVTAPPTTGGQPAPATPRQPSLCSFCFQPLHPDPGKAGQFLTLLGHPLRQVEAPPQLLPLFPIELGSLWVSGHTDSDTTLSPPSNMVIGPFVCFSFSHVFSLWQGCTYAMIICRGCLQNLI